MADGNSPRILPDLSQQLAAMQAQLTALASENASLRLSRSGKLTFKVSEKTGALMVCGMQKFPTTLYVSQWERILAAADDMRAFIAAHPELTRKAVA